MRKNGKTKENLYTLAFMLIVTVVCVSGVAFAYQLTKARIKLNRANLLKKAVLEAAGLMERDDPEAIAADFRQLVTEVKDENGRVAYYVVKDRGYVIPVSGTGLWGRIDAVVGLDAKLNRLNGVYFTKQNETPGLGARIDEKWFRTQFDGKEGPLTMVPEGEESGERQFDAITGATITSTGVRNMLNQLLKNAPEIVRKQQRGDGRKTMDE